MKEKFWMFVVNIILPFGFLMTVFVGSFTLARIVAGEITDPLKIYATIVMMIVGILGSWIWWRSR